MDSASYWGTNCQPIPLSIFFVNIKSSFKLIFCHHHLFASLSIHILSHFWYHNPLSNHRSNCSSSFPWALTELKDSQVHFVSVISLSSRLFNCFSNKALLHFTWSPPLLFKCSSCQIHYTLSSSHGLESSLLEVNYAY
mgnify:CR=1 FL=1